MNQNYVLEYTNLKLNLNNVILENLKLIEKIINPKQDKKLFSFYIT